MKKLPPIFLLSGVENCQNFHFLGLKFSPSHISSPLLLFFKIFTFAKGVTRGGELCLSYSYYLPETQLFVSASLHWQCLSTVHFVLILLMVNQGYM